MVAQFGTVIIEKHHLPIDRQNGPLLHELLIDRSIRRYPCLQAFGGARQQIAVAVIIAVKTDARICSVERA